MKNRYSVSFKTLYVFPNKFLQQKSMVNSNNVFFSPDKKKKALYSCCFVEEIYYIPMDWDLINTTETSYSYCCDINVGSF